MLDLIPTKAQWSGWSLPSKLTFIGTCVGAISLLLTIAFQIWPLSSGEPLLSKRQPVGSANVELLPVQERAVAVQTSEPRKIVDDCLLTPEIGHSECNIAQPVPKRLTIREKSAAEVLRNLEVDTPSDHFREEVKDLYLGRWTQESGWRATVSELPVRLVGGCWHCSFKELDSGTLVFARTTQDVSTFRPGDSVIVNGRIDRVSLLKSVGLEDATVSSNPDS